MRPNLTAIMSHMIRGFVMATPYKFYGHPSTDCENLFIETTTQVDVFYSLCEKFLRPPSQDEFIQQYIKACRQELVNKHVAFSDITKRIARAWATYIMELDFFCQLRDSKLFQDVIIDTKLDAEFGCDLKIIYNRHPTYVALYFNTKVSQDWRNVKRTRKVSVPVTIIDYPLDDFEADAIGNIHLYTFDHVFKLHERIKATQQKQGALFH